jgi:hypothetical protein
MIHPLGGSCGDFVHPLFEHSANQCSPVARLRSRPNLNVFIAQSRGRVFPGLRLPVAPLLAGDTAKVLEASTGRETTVKSEDIGLEARRRAGGSGDYEAKGWCRGSEEFRQELLAQVSELAGPEHACGIRQGMNSEEAKHMPKRGFPEWRK